MSEKFWKFVAWHLIPKRARYWVVVRQWAHATQGKWSHVEAPIVLALEVLQRMD